MAVLVKKNNGPQPAAAAACGSGAKSHASSGASSPENLAALRGNDVLNGKPPRPGGVGLGGGGEEGGGGMRKV